MSINQELLGELGYEIISTRKILERIPADKFDWKPHERSLTMGDLANHLTDIFAWYKMTLETNELDFASGYVPVRSQNAKELTTNFDNNVAGAKECLQRATPEVFLQNWTLRNGEHIVFTLPKTSVLRTFVVNHLVHHRAQLGIYLRLNDIPVPSMYGPSADEQ
jgi:uncharacterized damage-inducible protein DinB